MYIHLKNIFEKLKLFLQWLILVFETFLVHDHFTILKVLDSGFGLCIWKSWSLYLNGFWRSCYRMWRYL